MNKKKIKDYIDTLSTDKKVELCDAAFDGKIRYMDELDDEFGSMDLLDFLTRFDLDDANFRQNYYVVDDPRIVTFDYFDDDSCPCSIDDLVQYVYENHDALGDEGLQEILNQ